MAYGAGSAAAARAAAIAKAIKASGAIVSLEPNEFLMTLSKAEKPLVVFAEGGFLKKNYQYLTSYKGLAFLPNLRLYYNFPVILSLLPPGRYGFPTKLKN